MERRILLPEDNSNAVLVHEVKRIVEDEGEGIILVYNKNSSKHVGSVVPYDGDWILSTLEDQDYDEDLGHLLANWDEYEYKFVT